MFGIGLMVDRLAVGEGAAPCFVKVEEREGNLNAFGGEALGVARSVADCASPRGRR